MDKKLEKVQDRKDKILDYNTQMWTNSHDFRRCLIKNHANLYNTQMWTNFIEQNVNTKIGFDIKLYKSEGVRLATRNHVRRNANLSTSTALSNPFATRHMWRMVVSMWRMALILNTSQLRRFWTKLDIYSLIHTFQLKTNQRHEYCRDGSGY
jgi:hypothetical protein